MPNAHVVCQTFGRHGDAVEINRLRLTLCSRDCCDDVVPFFGSGGVLRSRG